MCSNSSVRNFGNEVCQTGHAYSKTGLIKLQYTVLRSLGWTPFLLNILKAYRRLLALEDMCLMCVVHLRSEVKFTPRSLMVLTASRGWLLTIKGCAKGLLIKNDTVKSLVFLTFNFMLFALDHWVTLSSSCCNFGRSGSHTLTTSEIAQSSTYFYKGNSLDRSLTIIRKNRGPSLVPCGTPAFISFQSDLQVFNLTRCCLP